MGQFGDLDMTLFHQTNKKSPLWMGNVEEAATRTTAVVASCVRRLLPSQLAVVWSLSFLAGKVRISDSTSILDEANVDCKIRPGTRLQSNRQICDADRFCGET